MSSLSDYATESQAAKMLELSPGKGDAWRHLRTHAPHIEMVTLFGYTAVRRSVLEDYCYGARQEVKPGSVGESNPKARLNEGEVLAIREEYIPGKVTMAEIAQRHGVSIGCIYHIVKRLTWRHL
jgi:hypothetical protein